MPKDHSAEHEVFAVEVAKGSDLAVAWRAAYPASQANDNTVRKSAHLLSKRPEVAARIQALRGRAMARHELSVERTLREVGSVLHNDPRRFFNRDGTIKPPHEWDDDMAMAVASIEAIPVVLHGTVDEEAAKKNPDAKRKPKVGHAYKIKFWSKMEAADKLMRHQGLFEKDNNQRRDNLALQINLVGADPSANATPGGVVVRANLVDGRSR